MDDPFAPAEPYRGLEPYRYCDRRIFFERQTDTIRLLHLVTIYRGSLLYGESGTGKSSLINAGLIPRTEDAGMAPTRLRVQPVEGHELVLERISRTGVANDWLPSPLLHADENAARTTLSTTAFTERLRAVSKGATQLLIFDQFEELVTLTADASAVDSALRAQQNIVDLLVSILHDPSLPTRLLFVFREDYLARLDLLFYNCPELPDQFVRLTAPSGDSLMPIIRGPFEELPGRWKQEIDETVASRLASELQPTRQTHRINLSQVQIACLQLWRAANPGTELADKGVPGLVNAFLSEALNTFAAPQRKIAVALLAAMITKAGTRKVVTEEELLDNVVRENGVARPSIGPVLARLVDDTKLVRRDRHRQTLTYEIVSEFLVPWIRQLRAASELRRAWQKVVLIGAAILFVVVAAGGSLYYRQYRSLTSQTLVQNANKHAEAADARAASAEAGLRELAAASTSDQLRVSLTQLADTRGALTQTAADLKAAQTANAELKERTAALEERSRQLQTQLDMTEGQLKVAAPKAQEYDALTNKYGNVRTGLDDAEHVRQERDGLRAQLETANRGPGPVATAQPKLAPVAFDVEIPEKTAKRVGDTGLLILKDGHSLGQDVYVLAGAEKDIKPFSNDDQQKKSALARLGRALKSCDGHSSKVSSPLDANLIAWCFNVEIYQRFDPRRVLGQVQTERGVPWNVYAIAFDKSKDSIEIEFRSPE
jgi:hypothetical protein